MTQISEHTYENGVRLVAEHVPGAQSLAMTALTPAGVASEPAGRQGVAAVLAEMICRGAGERDARAHSDALDQLGVQRRTNVESEHLRLGATMLGVRLHDALPLLMDMIRRPRLADASLEPSRDLAIQSIDALEDEPQQKVFDEIRRRHFPAPFGRSPYGERDDLARLTAEQVRGFRQQAMTPGRTILGFAGHFEWEALKNLVGTLIADWSGKSDEPREEAPAARGYTHHTAESAQVHIGLAYDAVPEPDERSMLQRAAASVLSGGMSGRLFTEVREKRGLCYAVGARYAATRDRGAMLAYAGTTTPRAQETLDVLTAELRRISAGIEQDEFERALVGMKSSLVMQGESTGARANAVATDQYVYGRPRTLDELIEKVDAITLDDLNAFVAANCAGDMTVVTIGPSPLELSD